MNGENGFRLSTVSRVQLERAARLLELQAQRAAAQGMQHERKTLADALREGFTLRGSDRPADDPAQVALF